MKKLEDQRLLKDLKSGGKEGHSAIKIIYKRNYEKVRGIILQRGGNEDEAKDVFQEAMIVFHRKVTNEQFRADSSIDTYIIAIARNLWHQIFRKPAYNLETELGEEVGNMSIDVDWDIISKEKVIRAIIEDLPSDCQKIIKHFYYENQSLEVIQRNFNLGSVQAAKNKKYRCMKALLKLFKEKGIKPDTF
ncbi:MAG: sigma-70 family RNA polymerase sigma factor [Bacteroidota bacterium]